MQSEPVSALETFRRSAFSSVMATGSDFIIASALVRLGVGAGASTFIGCVVGGLVSFSLNRNWAFQSRGKPSNELIRFVLVWLGSALLNAAGVAWVSGTGVTFGGSWAVIRIVVYAAWNYPLLRWFVFDNSPANLAARERGKSPALRR